MDKTLFEKLAKQVCLYFGDTCQGCPFYEFRKSVDAPSCTDAWRAYRKSAEIVLATWIGGTDYVKTQGAQGPQKSPETRREILQSAERCVCGDRDKTYKGPENSFALIAKLWESIIKARCVGPGVDVDLDAVTVALCMAALKIVRAATNETHMDSWVDLAGYAACGGEIAAEIKEENHEE